MLFSIQRSHRKAVICQSGNDLPCYRRLVSISVVITHFLIPECSPLHYLK